MRKTPYWVALIVVLFLLSACSASQAQEQLSESTAAAAPVIQSEAGQETEAAAKSSNVSEPASEEQSDHQEPDMPGDMEEEPEAMTENTDDAETMASETMAQDRPAWQQIALTNAKTGETFTLADFEGKTVFVEPMATWCSNCRRQLHNVRGAKEQLADEEVVFVALSVETNIDDAALASYAAGEGFDWLFAVVSPEMLGLLADEFGRSIANPPATPHFIIRADGTTTDLVTGIEPSDQIVAQIMAAQG